MAEKEVRVQKALADAGFCGRRRAEDLIRTGAVNANGRKVSLGDKVDPFRDIVTVEGKQVDIKPKKEFVYLMLYKPRGYVSTLSDELGRKCVTELLKDVPTRVYPVGRLDRNSEGLLLCTNDGGLANKLMHPSHGVPKTYRLTVTPAITDEQMAKLAEGVVIDGVKTLPAEIFERVMEENRTVVEITIREGRNRQIRKMCEAVGLTVSRLKRISEGGVRLGMLAPGKWRYLKVEEVSALHSLK